MNIFLSCATGTRNIKNWGAGGLQMPPPAPLFMSRGQERRPKIPTFHIAGTLGASEAIMQNITNNMKGKTKIIVIIIVLLISCSEKSTKPTMGFYPEQITVIKFEIKNCTLPHSYTLLYNQTLPLNQTLQPIEINSDSLFCININLNHPLYIALIEDNRGIDFFVIPNDTLSVIIDYQQGDLLSEIVRFQGETCEISNYLAHVRRHFYSGPRKEQAPSAFNQMIDSIFERELVVIDSLFELDKLPRWFVDIEEENIQYERDFNKLNQYNQRVWMHNQFIDKSNDDIETIVLNDLKNYWLESAIQLLSKFHHNRYDSLLQPKYADNDLIIEYSQNNIDSVNGRVSESALSYFVAHKISVLFWNNKLLKLSPSEFEQYSNQIDSFINKNSHLITDSVMLGVVINEKNRKIEEYLNQTTLKTNDKAPGFYLENNLGDFTTLSDFKDKVVLINFWATYCAPCIKSIPEKNNLYDNFIDEDFELINICMDSNNEAWKRIIDENGFKGTHFICRGEWERNLKSSYNIIGVPHYTLIDKNGLIIKNGIKDSIDYLIRLNL
jgi:thiol-disulfide isomerase/thioredoxin